MMSELRPSDVQYHQVGQSVPLISPPSTDSNTIEARPTEQQPNRFLLAYRGHGRQWQESQLIAMLGHLEAGNSISRAAELAGIPRKTAYRIMEADPQWQEAVTQCHAQGADFYEDAVRGIVTGEVDHRVTGALTIALKLRGKLQTQGNTTIHTTQNNYLTLLGVQRDPSPPTHADIHVHDSTHDTQSHTPDAGTTGV